LKTTGSVTGYFLRNIRTGSILKPERLKGEAEEIFPEIGTSIHRLASCSSSNDVAREMALGGAAEGTVVVSAEQTGGRGRSGHQWFSARDKGLYMSVILRPIRSDLTLLSIASALAVCEALRRSCRARIQIKWPNDIMCADRKLAGILCESVFQGERVSRVILGIGINLNHEPRDFPPDLRDHAVSLRTVSGKPVDSDELLDSLNASLRKWYGRFAAGDDAAVLAAFSEHAVFSSGEAVRVTTGEGEYRGVYGGVDARGGLILRARDGRRVFYEATVRAANPRRGGGRC